MLPRPAPWRAPRRGRPAPYAVLCSAVWLLMMSLGSLAAGITAQLMGGYGPVGPLGMMICPGAIAVIWPLARRLDAKSSASKAFGEE